MGLVASNSRIAGIRGSLAGMAGTSQPSTTEVAAGTLEASTLTPLFSTTTSSGSRMSNHFPEVGIDRSRRHPKWETLLGVSGPQLIELPLTEGDIVGPIPITRSIEGSLKYIQNHPLSATKWCIYRSTLRAPLS